MFGSGSAEEPPQFDGMQVTPGQVAVALLRPILAGLILLVGYFLLPINADSGYKGIGFLVGAGLLIAFCGWEIRHFMRSHRPVATALEMMVAVASLYIISFATTYYLFSEYSPGSMSERLTRNDALYFSLTVFTTTGFGDITPASQGARAMVSIQMVSTVVLIGLGLRLVTLLVNYKRKQEDN